MNLKVGFIGLGAMGMGMATNLAKAGVSLTVTSLNRAAPQLANEHANVRCTETIADLTRACEIIFTCLPHNEAAELVFFSEDGIFANGEPGLITCDCSTVGPEFALRQHKAASAVAIAHVEAPVFGGKLQADTADLVFVVSGDDQPVQRLLPLLSVMGRENVFVDGPGNANGMKVVQNGLGLVQAVAIAEAMNLCAAAGMDGKVFFDVVNAGRGMAATNLFQFHGHVYAEMQENDPPWQNDIAAKDIALACDLAAKFGIQPRLFKTAETALHNSLDGPGLLSLMKSVRSLSD